MSKVSKIVRATKVTIEFDEEEFTFLCTILGRIGGSLDKSLRGAAARLITSLAAAGINYEDFAKSHLIDQHGSGNIYFNDYSNPQTWEIK